MLHVRRFAGALILLLGLAELTPRAVAQERGIPPSQQHTVQATDALSARTLPSVDENALRTEDQQRAEQGLPHRYGRVLDVAFTPEEDGTWEKLPSGDLLWRLRLQSRGAVSLSVGFSRFGLPPSAEVYLHSPTDSLAHGPYTAIDETNGEHWTPLVQAEELVVELTVSPNQRDEVDLQIGSVVHGYRPILSTDEQNSVKKSGSCNIDTACEEADPWRNQVRSVGGYGFRREEDALFCTGTLLNTTAGDQTPFFLTAEHCIQSPSDANSMVFFWNYQNATCRSPGSSESGDVTDDDPLDQTSTGAILRARHGNWHTSRSRISGKSDHVLVQIDDVIPPSYNLFRSGWSRRERATNESVTIHHPDGHGKRISFDDEPSSITSYLQSSGGNTHLRIGDWSRGTTEPGSSGAPLFDRNRRVVGVLSGGSASCLGGGTGSEDNNQPDWYGRFALAFSNGDYRDTPFAKWLDPSNTNDMIVDGEDLRPDDTPPARPSNFTVDVASPDSVNLTWEAPGNDDVSGTALKYQLRLRKNDPIKTESDFESALPAGNLPRPQPAGRQQSVTLSVNPDTSYNFALRAIDNGGNVSELSILNRDVTPVTALRLGKPAPNPTHSRASIPVVTTEPRQVEVQLYDALGRKVQQVFNQEVQPFRRRFVEFNVSSLSSGIYFVHIRSNGVTRTKKISVVR